MPEILQTLKQAFLAYADAAAEAIRRLGMGQASSQMNSVWAATNPTSTPCSQAGSDSAAVNHLQLPAFYQSDKRKKGKKKKAMKKLREMRVYISGKHGGKRILVD